MATTHQPYQLGIHATRRALVARPVVLAARRLARTGGLLERDDDGVAWTAHVHAASPRLVAGERRRDVEMREGPDLDLCQPAANAGALDGERRARRHGAQADLPERPLHRQFDYRDRVGLRHYRAIHALVARVGHDDLGRAAGYRHVNEWRRAEVGVTPAHLDAVGHGGDAAATTRCGTRFVLRSHDRSVRRGGNHRRCDHRGRVRRRRHSRWWRPRGRLRSHRLRRRGGVVGRGRHSAAVPPEHPEHECGDEPTGGDHRGHCHHRAEPAAVARTASTSDSRRIVRGTRFGNAVRGRRVALYLPTQRKGFMVHSRGAVDQRAQRVVAHLGERVGAQRVR